MSSDIAISVQDVCKSFHIYDSPRGRLLQMLSRGRRNYFREFWALRDVSLVVRKGETVGIVGHNGSGKSTLLQIICGTLNQTRGAVSTHGRIAALLELGSGFNPEFSGRENVYLNAALLGLSRDETEKRFAAIEAFAEIGEFIDQPVKTYSSGMKVRLAFAVAINVDPEILVVDEALSVGDERFQRKCYSRIEQIKENGATILFVSHSGAAVVNLCDRAVLLDGGSKLAEGEPKYIVGQYQRLLYAPAERAAEIRAEILSGVVPLKSLPDTATNLVKDEVLEEDSSSTEDFYDPHLLPTSTLAYESHGARILEPHIVNEAGQRVNCLVRGCRYQYRYRVEFDHSAEAVRFGMLIKTKSGTELGGCVSAADLAGALSMVGAGTSVNVSFSFECLLNPGTYFLNAGITGKTGGGDETYLYRLLDACIFRVQPVANNCATSIIDFHCNAEIKQIVNE